jgi:hypothetical protein
MDPRDREQMGKIVLYGVAIVIAYYLLLWLFKYIVAGLAILGVGYLFLEYQKHNRSRW